MGCVSSTLLNQSEDFPKLGGSAAFSHHIVSLTSTTYGLLTLDTPPPPSAPPLETINSWDLMSGLESDDKNLTTFLDKYEAICPPSGEKRAVLYTTSLRGVRKTFEDCEAARSALRGLGIPVCERDISMDRGFRDELREMIKLKARGSHECVPPRLFVQGRYVGGIEEVMKIVEEGSIAKLLEGLPKMAAAGACSCEGCGGVGFLPCFACHGSCKMVVDVGVKKRSVVVKCNDCNENGLVLCPICSVY